MVFLHLMVCQNFLELGKRNVNTVYPWKTAMRTAVERHALFIVYLWFPNCAPSCLGTLEDNLKYQGKHRDTNNLLYILKTIMSRQFIVSTLDHVCL